MKWILIVVTLHNPITDAPGREMHQPFPSRQDCDVALSRVMLQSSTEGWGYCVPEHMETWYYPEKRTSP